jgi:AraC-like DNA-binding protein
MQAKKPFLQPGYKLIDLSNDTGIPIYRISAYVNRRKNLNFFGYLNQFRIDYCLEKFAAKEYKSKTLEALAEECGFHNRTTFIRVFKSVTGMNPTEYIRHR